MTDEKAGPKLFPTWRYASDGKGGTKSALLQNAGEEKALGKGWYDNPGNVPLKGKGKSGESAKKPSKPRKPRKPKKPAAEK